MFGIKFYRNASLGSLRLPAFDFRTDTTLPSINSKLLLDNQFNTKASTHSNTNLNQHLSH